MNFFDFLRFSLIFFDFLWILFKFAFSKRDVPENPYESLKILHTEQDFSKKKLLQQSQSRSHSKNGQELSDSASSGELNLLDLMKHELKRSENIKLGDLKQGIEENISKIAEDTDEEAKFHMMLCKISIFSLIFPIFPIFTGFSSGKTRIARNNCRNISS